jgi:SAM-dependent methyltransferase
MSAGLPLSAGDLEDVPCPLCRDPGRDLLHDFAPFRVVRCRACGLAYLSPRPGASAARRLYAAGDYFDGYSGAAAGYGLQERSLRAAFRRFLRTLRRRGLTGGRLLEIGCAYGHFLAEARPHFDHLAGMDCSPAAARKAAGLADYAGCGGIEELPPEQGQFDLAVAFNVIEHVHDPVGFAARVRERLRAGGILALATPDFGSFWYRLAGRRWPSFKVPEHVAFYDRRSLASLLERAGYGGPERLPFPFAAPASLVALKLGLRLPKPLERVQIWIPRVMLAAAARR